MSQIFVSYAHDDDSTVMPVVDNLSRHFRVWIDRAGIKSGDQWYKSIQDNLQKSDAVLIFVSEQSKDRPWVLHEIEEAQKHGKPCHPYLIEAVRTVPKAIKETQYLDGTQLGAFEKLMDALPKSARHQGNTIIDPALFNTDTTFGDIAATLNDDVKLPQLDEINFKVSITTLPLFLTRYCKVYLVGRSDDTLEAEDYVQLCVLMSGRDYRDYKVVTDAINNVLKRPDFPLRMLVVEGPANRDPINDEKGYGLDPSHPDEWQDAYTAIKRALGQYPRATPQIFFNGPGVLLYPVGADRRDLSPFELYQYEYGKKPAVYKRVMWHGLIFGQDSG